MTDREPLVRVDTRWDGTHGIGRYAREVVSRLTMPWQPLAATGSPSSPREAARRDPGLRPADLVYSPGYNVSLASRARQLVTVHDLIHLDVGGAKGRMYRAYYDAVLKPVIKRSGTVLTVSETSAGAIRGWLRDDHVEVVNAGIGASAAFTSDGPVFTSERPYAIYVGNMRPHKNLDVLLRAIVAAPFDLVLLVPPTESVEVRRRCNELGISERTTLLSNVSDEELARYYRGAAVCAMPSLLEGFGLPALESIMCGTPVAYWRGCHAVAETVAGFGSAVDQADDEKAWLRGLEEAAQKRSRGNSASREYGWDQTSALITETIEGLLR